jgi:hypothetical protein
MMTPNSSELTGSQRVGLGIIAFFYGESVAAPLFILFVMFRFAGNWWMLLHHTKFTLVRLIQTTAFNGLICAITWFIFGSLLVWLWHPASMWSHRRWNYAAAVPLALLAPGVLAMLLWRLHHSAPQIAVMEFPLFAEMAGFMLISSLVALHKYPGMVRHAEEKLASGDEFRF